MGNIYDKSYKNASLLLFEKSNAKLSNTKDYINTINVSENAPNLDFLRVRQSDAAPFCENYAKLYFDTKQLENT